MQEPMKKIVYTSPYVPAEWIAAHGLRPCRIVPGACDGEELQGEMEGLCPFAGAFVSAVCGDPGADAVVLTTTCDQMRRAADLIRTRSGIPVFLMNIPATWQQAAAFQLYVSELRRLGRFLVGHGGKPPAPRKLAAVIGRFEKTRAKLRAARGRLPARRYAEAVAGWGRTGRVNLKGKLPYRRQSGIPLALVGGPLPPDEFRIFDVIEKLGGRIVLDGTENGERTMPAALEPGSVREDPMQALAAAYFDAMRDAFRRPNSLLYSWLKREIRDSGARGIIVRNYIWCDIWRAEIQRIAECFKLPLLHLDVASGAASRERTVSRLQAFLEVQNERDSAKNRARRMG